MDLPNYHGYIGIVVATLGGAAVGVERQRSGHAIGTRARLGGVRTFTLLGGVAGLAGWLATLQFTGFALLLAAGAVALVVVAYAAASRDNVDATTEMAALVVIAAGVAAGWAGWRSPAPRLRSARCCSWRNPVCMPSSRASMTTNCAPPRDSG